MLLLSLVGIAVLISTILFLFGWLWYSKFLFGNYNTKKHENMKLALVIEFLSCLLFSIAIIIVFAPFDWYFGFINGLVISLAIIFPFGISDAIWNENRSFRGFIIALFHRMLQVIIAFTLAGAANNFLLPIIVNYN